MKYVKLAFQYMKHKKFWLIALFSVIPSIAMSFFSSFSSTISLFINFFDRESYSFVDIYRSISEIDLQSFLVLLVILIVLSLLLSIIIGTIQRHMRTGCFAITNVFKRINENFFASFVALGAIFIFITVYGLIITCAISAWYLITRNTIATFVLSLIFVLAFFVIFMIMLTLLSLTCPNMVCTGQKLWDSVSISIKAVRPKLFQLLIAFTLPLLLFFAVQVGIIFANIRTLQIILDSIMMIFISCSYPVIIFVAYYDIFEKDREDLLPENNL